MREGRQHRSLRHVAAFAGAALVALAGCHSDHEGGGAPVAAVVVEPPVPAPADLLAQIALATPDATWKKLQHGAGGTFGILPSTLGGLACAALGVDPSLGPEVDGASPAFAVVAGDPTAPSWALAMKLVDTRAGARLTGGETARFATRDVAGLTVLEPRGAAPPGARARPIVALSRAGYLVLARDEASVAALAPYATRTLPVAKLSPEQVAIDLPGAALAGPVRSALARAWGQRETALLESDRALRLEHDGGAPDFGDPRAIVGSLDATVEQRLAALGDVQRLHVGIDADDATLRVNAYAPPATPTGPAHQAMEAMNVGDLAPLRALAKDTAAVLLLRADAAARADAATKTGDALAGALGPRWKPADDKRVRGALDDWARAHGDWTAYSLVWGPTAKGALIDTPALDGELVTRALRAAVDEISHPSALRAPLAEWFDLKDVSTGSLTLPNGAAATFAAFTGQAKGEPPRPLFTLGWTAASGGDARISVATAADAPALLVPSDLGATLGDDPTMRLLLEPVGPAAGALVLQAGKAPACGGVPGGAVLAWGRRPLKSEGGEVATMWGTLLLSDAALRCLAPAFF